MDDDLIGYGPELIGYGGDELIGDDDDDDLDDFLGVMGDDDDDDDDDEIGARRGRRGRRRYRRMRRKAKRRKMIRRLARGGVYKAGQIAAQGRKLFLGAQATQGVAAGALTLSTTVQELCRVDQLYVAADDGAGTVLNPATYDISDIKVGTQSQFTSNDPVSGIMFTQNNSAQFQGFAMTTIQPGTQFAVLIQSAPAASIFKLAATATALR